MSTAAASAPAVQTELFPGRGCLPAQIVVGPFGIHGDWLTKALQLDPWDLHAWHGDELGAPRDYSSSRRGYFYTAGGVRRILQLLGYAELVQVIEQQPGPPAKRTAP